MPSAFIAVVPVLCLQNLPSDSIGSSLKKPLLHSVLWKMNDTSLVTPRVAQWVHGATAAHLGLSAGGRDQIGAGFHGPAGCGWSA